MDTKIVIIYVIVSDYLQAIHHYEDPQCRMSDAEVITTAIVSALFFSGRYETACSLMQGRQYMPSMLSKSRFNRRLHRVKPLLLNLFALLGERFKDENEEVIYLIDTFPISVCDNWRIGRCRLYKGEAYRGYIASKRRYYYGLKLHLMVTYSGQPVELFLTPAAESDVAGLELFDFDVPPGSEVYADKIYNNYLLEDILREAGIEFLPIRKKNSKRKLPPWLDYWQKKSRKMIETTGSLLERRLPKSIHAVTAVGFELKVVLFVLAESFSHLFKVAT